MIFIETVGFLVELEALHPTGLSGLVSIRRLLGASAPNSLRAETRPESPAGGKGSNSTKNPTVSMNTTTGFKFLLQKMREYPHFFVQVLLNTAKKK